MTEREFHAKEILDVACNRHKIALDKESEKVVDCITLPCRKCGFAIGGFSRNCEETAREWCASEHIERPKLSKNEKIFLELLNPKCCKYMARDKEGKLFIFLDEPFKNDAFWNGHRMFACLSSIIIENLNFNMVKWEDEKPWSVEDLKKLLVEE